MIEIVFNLPVLFFLLGVWEAFHDALTDGPHLLLIGSLIIGAFSSKLSGNEELLYRFVGGDIFTGAQCFFRSA